MVTLQSAENALKSYYLGVVADQLNTAVNPFLAKIRKTSNDVWGKEVRKMAPYGLNGGISAGTETGDLPAAGGNNYVQFVLSLKNLYGKIEISDKAIRASANNAGAFVNLLNDEMEGLVKAASFNFGRMLFGDQYGILATVASATGTAIKLDSVKYVMEGMIIDVLDDVSGVITGLSGKRILSIDRDTNTITIDSAGATAETGNIITLQGSFNNELTGLAAIFQKTGSIYGLSRSDYKWLIPRMDDKTTEISDITMQKMIDDLEEISGSTVNYLLCSAGVKRAYQKYLNTYKRNIDVLNLAGGRTALSFNGIPLVSDRFCPENTMYFLNTEDFSLHQLCDWKWLEGEDGKVLKQIPNKPIYTATLVKYADLICNRISGQGCMSALTEA